MLDVDDLYPEHPKLVRLGAWCEVAGWLNLAALCWCKRYRTDGVIPRMTVWRLALFRDMSIEGIAVTPERVAEHLVAVGLWRDDGPVYVIHDFLAYQESRAHLLERQERDRQRKQAARERAAARRAAARARMARTRAANVLRTCCERSANVTRTVREHGANIVRTGSAQVSDSPEETGQSECPRGFRAESSRPSPLSPLPFQEKETPDARARSNWEATRARNTDRSGPARASPLRLGDVLAQAYAAASDRGRP